MVSKRNLIYIFIIFISNFIFALEINPFIKVNKDKIFLSDLITTDNTEYINQAKNIQITYSPDPGEEKSVSGNFVKSRLRQLKVKKLDDIYIPNKIIIQREYQILSKSRIRDSVINEIKNNYNMEKIDYELEIRADENIKLPLGDVQINTDIRRLDGENIGYFNSNIEILVNGERYDNIYIKLRLGQKRSVYVLNRDVKRGEVFSEEDISVKSEIVFNNVGNNNTIKSLDNLEEMVYRNNMRKGREINIRNFERKKLFKRNDEVEIIISNNGITIKTLGRALEDGYKGELVKVRNVNSKKELTGLVKEDGTVEVK
ncbi:MAG: flagellar basal body P-ring formation chaperone FlgA [Fusobacteriota bacterium]